MLTKHIKIKQLNTVSKKSLSNNDLLLVETPIQVTIENVVYQLNCIPQFVEFLIQGVCFRKHQSLQKIRLTNPETNHYTVSFEEGSYSMSPYPIDELSIQPHDLIQWVRTFKDQQPLYRQTGATETVGILLADGSIFAVECLEFETAFSKLLGGVIRKGIDYFPVIFISHRITLNHAHLIDTLNPNIVICQSAITDQALDHFLAKKRTVYGFCRKNKFNRYSNFHL